MFRRPLAMLARLLSGVLLPLTVLVVAALAGESGETRGRAPAVGPAPPQFRFARMIYVDYAARGFGRGWWQQDWPEAEEHFTQNLRRLTRVNVGESVTINLADENLFDYPWLYATQTGY